MDERVERRLVDVATELVNSKRWEAAAGTQLDGSMIGVIAANAAVPLLGLDVGMYKIVESIIVHPTTRVVTSERAGPVAGTMDDADLHVIGQAWANAGPLLLSWDAVLDDSRNPARGRNVVIHEFAHKIDMRDGYGDGVPPVPTIELPEWDDLLRHEFEDDTATPRVLRPYAWSNPAEFFAVASEAFFCVPVPLSRDRPELYAMLRSFYRQDPAVRLGPET